MFLDNKYTKWYYQIIEQANDRCLDGYKESHHVIPKCMGGTDTLDNRVDLTAREHALCHWLLTKMVEGPNKGKMFYALRSLVTMKSAVQYRHVKVPTKVIAIAREESRKYSSEVQLGRKRSKESIEKQRQTMTGRTRDPSFAEKISLALKGRTHSKSHKLKNSKAQSGKKLSEETKEKLRVKKSDEAKEKMKQAWIQRKST